MGQVHIRDLVAPSGVTGGGWRQGFISLVHPPWIGTSSGGYQTPRESITHVSSVLVSADWPHVEFNSGVT